jgi:hypothetical protein
MISSTPVGGSQAEVLSTDERVQYIDWQRPLSGEHSFRVGHSTLSMPAPHDPDSQRKKFTSKQVPAQIMRRARYRT